MNLRVSTILVLALLVAGGTTFLIYRMLRFGSANRQLTGQILVAARTLEIGAVIHDYDVKFGTWSGPVPKGYLSQKEPLLGRGVIARIYEGEPVMESRLAKPGAGGGLAATIPPGMRAVAVRVNDIVGVAGFAVPGMRVDVLVAGVPPGSPAAEGPAVKTILQNVEVLSAGQNYQKDAEGKPVVVPVVNLLVTPEQAEILSLAGNETRLQLVLRNPLDTEPSKPPGTSLTALFDRPRPVAPRTRPVPAGAPPAKPALTAPEPYQIEIFNGPKRTEASFARLMEEPE